MQPHAAHAKALYLPSLHLIKPSCELDSIAESARPTSNYKEHQQDTSQDHLLNQFLVLLNEEEVLLPTKKRRFTFDLADPFSGSSE